VVGRGLGLQQLLAPDLAHRVALADLALSVLDSPDVIGPAGTSSVGRWPNDRAAITRPGTILSQTPSISAASNMSCERATALAIAMDVTAEQRQLHPGAALGDAVTHGRHAAGELGDATGPAHRRLEQARVLVERQVCRQHVVVGRDDGHVRLDHGPQLELVHPADREAVREGGAAEVPRAGALLGGGPGCALG
jgi:hypothetical protein